MRHVDSVMRIVNGYAQPFAVKEADLRRVLVRQLRGILEVRAIQEWLAKR